MRIVIACPAWNHSTMGHRLLPWRACARAAGEVLLIASSYWLYGPESRLQPEPPKGLTPQTVNAIGNRSKGPILAFQEKRM